jgi:hypothetical protein
MPGWAVTREGPVLHVLLPATIASSEWETLLDAIQAAIQGAGDPPIAIVELRESAHSSSDALRSALVEGLIDTLRASGVAVRHSND